MAQHFETSAEEMIHAVRQQRLEGVIAKRRDSRYEAGKRSGSWAKYRLNRGQELVIGGYLPGKHGVDSIIVGYYRGNELVYIARVRNGFMPATRGQVFGRLRPLEEAACPFVNLPETHKGRWGDGLTAEDMEKCAWVRPELVAQIEFLEWTESEHLRHSKFAGLRRDKDTRAVITGRTLVEEGRRPDLFGADFAASASRNVSWMANIRSAHSCLPECSKRLRKKFSVPLSMK